MSPIRWPVLLLVFAACLPGAEEPPPPAEPATETPPAEAEPAKPPRKTVLHRIPARVLKSGPRCLLAYEGKLVPGPARLLGLGTDVPVTIQVCDGNFAIVKPVGSGELPERCHLQWVEVVDDPE